MSDAHFKRGDLEKILSVKSVLDKEYFRHYTQIELAQMAGTNEFTLKNGFKSLTKKTIHEYLTEVRVAKAKDLLENTDMPLKLIAGRIGLDKSNLNRTFKKITGITPNKWRLENRNNNKSHLYQK